MSQATGADARVAALMRGHGRSLERVARRVSLCADDAEEAVQRALEIYLRRLDTIEAATEGAWMRVVVRNEALAVRRSRAQQVADDAPDFDGLIAHDGRPIDERIESAERVARSAEALRHLKRDEAQALMLKAEGYSYAQIGERLGWSYTKVNRCITEGRRRFMAVYRDIEAGAECARFAPVLRALVDGGASPQDVVTLRPHLRSCMRCRAEIRRLHGVRWPKVAAFVPLPLLLRFQSLAARVLGEPAAAQLAAGGGGGRGIGAAALVTLCLGGAGAGGYCVVKAAEPDRPAKPRVQRAERPERARLAVAAVVTPAPTPARPKSRPAPSPTPSPEPSPSPSPEPEVRVERQELGFEASASVATPPRRSPEPSATADFGFEG